MGRAGKQRRRERLAEQRRQEWERRQDTKAGEIERRERTATVVVPLKANTAPPIDRSGWQQYPASMKSVEGEDCPVCGKGLNGALTQSTKKIAVTVDEAAGLLSVSRSTIDRMCKMGILPGRFEFMGAIRFHLPTIEAWAEEQVTKREQNCGALQE